MSSFISVNAIGLLFIIAINPLFLALLFFIA